MRHEFLAMWFLSIVSSAVIAAETQSGGQSPPEVTHTQKGPTGYEVRFRYQDPNAKRVQIKGEWYFGDPSQLPSSSTFTNTIVTPALMPKDWKPGFFPIQSPNTNGANFPLVDMTKEPDGVWSYTTPLPSGWFTYSFEVDCPGPTCVRVADPSNLPWSEAGPTTPKSKQKQSQVFVPSDPKFGTIDYSWQAPSPIAQGTLTGIEYATPYAVSATGMNSMVVYTPPGYDVRKATPYPTVYLLHGRGENDTAWSTRGIVGNILDNLIATGQIKPMVVVMPNGTGLKGDSPNGYDQSFHIKDILDTLIPYIERHYRVSTLPAERAMAGLSQGSGVTNAMLFSHPGAFGYYGSFSRGPSYLVPSASALTAQQVAELKQVKGVFVGAGWEELRYPYSPFMVDTLTSVGVPVTPIFTHGGHEWYLWRILVRDFLTRTAFFPTVNEKCPQCAAGS